MKRFKPMAMLLGMLVLASLSSCTKEGVYTPKKKIQRVYYSSTYTDKYLSQSWDWDGKLLEAINHYSGGNLSWTENFSYDGNRLVRIDDYLSSEYITYAYDGKQLKSADYYYKGNLELSTAYTYANGKLSKMVITEYGSKKSEKDRRLQNMNMPFQSEVVEVVSKFMAKAAASRMEKDFYIVSLQFTWDGDNVSKMIENEDGIMRTVTLQYDTKINPLKGFHNLFSDVDGDFLNWSKNNVTKMIVARSGEDNHVITFTYQYNSDDYPTMVIQRDADEDYQYTTYYDYE